MGYTGSDPTIIQFEIKKSYQLLSVLASRPGPLADYFQSIGKDLVHEAAKLWAFLEQNEAVLIIFHNFFKWSVIYK